MKPRLRDRKSLPTPTLNLSQHLRKVVWAGVDNAALNTRKMPIRKMPILAGPLKGEVMFCSTGVLCVSSLWKV